MGPKDVPESVTDASGAAALAAEALSHVRNTIVSVKSYPDEIEIEEEPRIGVFVCFCGSNIGAAAPARKASTMNTGSILPVHMILMTLMLGGY